MSHIKVRINNAFRMQTHWKRMLWTEHQTAHGLVIKDTSSLRKIILPTSSPSSKATVGIAKIMW